MEPGEGGAMGAAALSGPLADRLRPAALDEYVGQQHLLGPGKILRQLLERDQIPSMIFWGPPGVGKTTLASIIANRTRSAFVNFSAVTSGIKEIKEIMNRAQENRAYPKRRAAAGRPAGRTMQRRPWLRPARHCRRALYQIEKSDP